MHQWLDVDRGMPPALHDDELVCSTCAYQPSSNNLRCSARLCPSFRKTWACSSILWAN